MRRRWNPWLLILLLCPAVPTFAGDDADPLPIAATWSLSGLRVAGPVVGPELSVPSDFRPSVESGSDGDVVWESVGVGGADWVRFEEPGDGLASSPDVLIELLQTIHADVFENDELQSIEALPGRLRLIGRGTVLKRVRRSFDWLMSGLAPVLTLDATYAVSRPEARILAVAHARLLPRRWTRVYLQRRAQPFCVDYDIEIAQRATAMDPVMKDLPEGQELYARYHPGESVSLLEIWCGEVEHTEVRSVDVGTVRNVPEGNAPGTLSFPISRALRAHTVLVLQNAKPSTHTLRFNHQGRESVLTLSLGAPAAALPETETQRPRPLALLRADAVAGSLDFGVRAQDPEEWADRMSGIALSRGYEDDDLQLQQVAPVGCVFAEGLPRVLAIVRESLRREEAALAGVRATLRVLTVEEATYRKGAAAGQIRIGHVLGGDARARLAASGAGRGLGVQLPLAYGLQAGVRVGTSIPGLYDFDVEVAQEAAGLDPHTTAYFQGLAGRLRVERRGSETWLSFHGALEWADPEAGRIELSFRPPVSMDLQHDDWRKEPVERRTLSLPAIGAGSTPIDAAFPLRSLDGVEHLLAVVMRGGEAQLVLGSVTR